MTKKEVIVCVVPKLKGLLSKCRPCSPGRNVSHWLKGGEWDAYYDYFPRKSPHAHHGAACSKSGMAVLGRCTLASVPRHNQFLQLDLGLYDLACDCMRRICDKNRSDHLCGAKTAGFTIEVQTLLPREKSCPLIRMITDLGSLE